MDKRLSDIKFENKHNRTIRKEDLDIKMEYTIKAMKCVTPKYRKKIIITIDFKGEMAGLFAPKCIDSNAADLEKK